MLLALKDSQAVQAVGERPVTIGTLPVFADLRREVERRGWRFHSSVETLPPDGEIIVLWDIASFAGLPRDIARRSAGRRIAFCLESPLIAHRAYHRLPTIAGLASHLFLFPGASDLVPGGRAAFHDLFWPNPQPEIGSWPGPDERELLIMIASNKRAHRGWEGWRMHGPQRALRMGLSKAIAASYALRGKWTVPDLYSDRLEAIRHFSSTGRFHIYGVGWNKRVQQEARYRSAISLSYRGPVKDKVAVMQGYRFALCFENTTFPGYITEKIFDCFFAGVIPVYLGAPDIDKYIPTDCFIRVTDFASFEALEEYLVGLSDHEVHGYQQRIKSFLTSDRFTPFTNSSLISQLLRAVEDQVQRRLSGS